MDEDIQHWLRLADSHMVSAEALCHIGQGLHAIFFLQQAVEKTPKALVLRQTRALPPRIHNLRKLSELCALSLTDEQVLLLEKLSEFYVESRYPGPWGEAPPEATAAESERLMSAAKKLIAWLKVQI